MRARFVVSGLLFAASLIAAPLAQQTKATFEVVSIKPRGFSSESELRGFASGMGMCGGYRFTPNGNRVNLPGTNICSLLRMAFDLTEYQIVAPAWIFVSVSTGARNPSKRSLSTTSTAIA